MIKPTESLMVKVPMALDFAQSSVMILNTDDQEVILDAIGWYKLQYDYDILGNQIDLEV